jgi:hypothetical protein
MRKCDCDLLAVQGGDILRRQEQKVADYQQRRGTSSLNVDFYKIFVALLFRLLDTDGKHTLVHPACCSTK